MGNKRLFIGLALIALLSAGTTYAALSDSLELYSSMDTATPAVNASYWADVSANGYHSTSDIAAYVGTGNRSTALDFTGGTDRMKVLDGYSSVFDPGTDNYSVSLWYNEQTIDSYAYLLSKGNCGASDTPGFCLASVNGEPRIRFEDIQETDDHLSILAGTGDISNGGWHHLVAVFDRTGAYSAANTVSLYVDNVFRNSAVVNDIAGLPFNVTNSGYEFMLGGQSTSTSHNFEGYIDDVAIYRGALSSTDVSTLYSATTLNQNTITSVPAVAIHNFETNLGIARADGTVPDDYGLSANPDAPFNGVLKGVPATVVHDATRGDNVISLPGVATADNEYIDYGKVLDLDADTSFTSSIWFKVDHFIDDEIGYAENIIQDHKGGVGWKMYCYAPSNRTDGPNGSISCYVQTDSGSRAKLRFAADDGLGGFNDFLNDSGWHHFVMTYDSDENKLTAYIDGMSSGASGTSNGWTAPDGTVYTDDGSFINDNPIRLGAAYNEGSPLEGELDDFAFWTRALTETEVLALYNGADPRGITVPGDTNEDNIVNDDDANMVASHWGQTIAGGASVGDFNGDGVVNGADASIMAANWGNHNEAAGESNVPEPSTLILLGLGTLIVAVGRRHQ